MWHSTKEIIHTALSLSTGPVCCSKSVDDIAKLKCQCKLAITVNWHYKNKIWLDAPITEIRAVFNSFVTGKPIWWKQSQLDIYHAANINLCESTIKKTLFLSISVHMNTSPQAARYLPPQLCDYLMSWSQHRPILLLLIQTNSAPLKWTFESCYRFFYFNFCEEDLNNAYRQAEHFDFYTCNKLTTHGDSY